MNNYNSSTLEGNLTKDPVIRQTQDGRRVANFTIASTIGSKQNPVTAFVPIVAWNYEAEAAASLKKGDRALVAGYLNSRVYDDQNGQRHYVLEIVARIVAKRPRTGQQEAGQQQANNGGAVDWQGQYGTTRGTNAQQEDIPF